MEDEKSSYFSDYDVLVAVNNEKSAEPKFWHKAEDRLLRERLVLKRIKPPVELIVHSYPDINNQLTVGRPFFLDILRDGIVLFEAKGSHFAKPGTMTAEQKHEEAQKYFGEWYKSSLTALEVSEFCFGKSQSKIDICGKPRFSPIRVQSAFIIAYCRHCRFTARTIISRNCAHRLMTERQNLSPSGRRISSFTGAILSCCAALMWRRAIPLIMQSPLKSCNGFMSG